MPIIFHIMNVKKYVKKVKKQILMNYAYFKRSKLPPRTFCLNTFVSVCVRKEIHHKKLAM